MTSSARSKSRLLHARSGQATAAPLNSVMKSRRFICLLLPRVSRPELPKDRRSVHSNPQNAARPHDATGGKSGDHDNSDPIRGPNLRVRRTILQASKSGK
jgi:hypothetical protein